jgi:hypothetical protein
MNRIEEVPHLRSAWRQLDDAGRMSLVTQIRDITLRIVEPLKKTIPLPYPDRILAEHQAKGILLQWDLSHHEDALAFCTHLRRATGGVSPYQQMAAELLDICTQVLVQGTFSDRDRDWIFDAYSALDGVAVTAGEKHSKAQAEKAKKKRGKGDDGRTLGELIQTLTQNHPDAKPSEIWPHLKSMIEEWAGYCDEKTSDTTAFYVYPFGEGSKTISYKQFGDRVREIKNAG